EILISESAWEEMTCLFAPSLAGERRNTDERHRFPTSLIFWARPPN
ncbi:type VII secretion system (T7SS), usher family protein, partial [Escherichia coli]